MFIFSWFGAKKLDDSNKPGALDQTLARMQKKQKERARHLNQLEKENPPKLK